MSFSALAGAQAEVSKSMPASIETMNVCDIFFGVTIVHSSRQISVTPLIIYTNRSGEHCTHL
jgi:hypothetical protein